MERWLAVAAPRSVRQAIPLRDGGRYWIPGSGYRLGPQ